MKLGSVNAVLVGIMALAMIVGACNICQAVDRNYVFTSYHAYITYGAGEDKLQALQYRAEAMAMAKKLLDQGYDVDVYGPDLEKNLGDALDGMGREIGNTLVVFYYAGHSTPDGGFYNYDGSGKIYSDKDANIAFGITQGNVGALAVILDRCYGDLILNGARSKGKCIWILAGANKTWASGILTHGLVYTPGSAQTLGGIADWAFQANATFVHSDSWMSAIGGFSASLAPVVINQYPPTAPQPPPSSVPSQFRPRVVYPAHPLIWYRLFRMYLASQIFPDCLTSGL